MYLFHYLKAWFNSWLTYMWWDSTEVERALRNFGSFTGPEFESHLGHFFEFEFSFLYREKINFFPSPGEMSRVRSSWTRELKAIMPFLEVRPAAACHKWYGILNPYTHGRTTEYQCTRPSITQAMEIVGSGCKPMCLPRSTKEIAL